MTRPLVSVAVALMLAALVARSLPPARAVLASDPDGSVPGILHIHTTRSDGRSDPAAIAAEAARAGIAFVIFTDHGDGTRVPDPPAYRSGVLCLDAVEISTAGGHYVAIGMRPAPYPLRGEPRDVVEDVARLGGLGIAAHPDSQKRELHWDEWSAPIDGLELINLDTSWRRQVRMPGWPRKLALAGALGAYLFRPPEVIASLIDSPDDNTSRWDALTRDRQVVGLAGTDAHAKLAFGDREPGDNWMTLPLPSYRASFLTLTIHVQPQSPRTGDATADGASIIAALRAGHVYTAVDGLASPPSFRFSATSSRGTVEEGDTISSGDPVTFHVRSNAPRAFTTTIRRDGMIVAAGNQNELTLEGGANPGVYRAEIHASDRAGQPPWIISNPIYVRSLDAPARVLQQRPAATESRALLVDGPKGWNEEHEQHSLATLQPAPGEGREGLNLSYMLSAAPDTNPFVALTTATPKGIAGFDRLTFTARTDKPTRVSVQLRAAGKGDRWRRSIYLDTVPREVSVSFDEMSATTEAQTLAPRLVDVDTILFVIDTTHTKRGSSGEITLTSAALQR